MTEQKNEVSTVTTAADWGLPINGLPIGVLALVDTRINKQLERAAHSMSEAEGMVPPHLIGKPVTCFAVITRALTWKLDPFSVAQSTYSPAPGKVGYEGKLVHAILMSSGRIEGPITYTLYGDWSKLRGKCTKKKSDKGKEYHVATWKEEDEVGLGVTVSAMIKGEDKPRSVDVDLNTCHPRNSTLWALRPNQQICYAAARVFANVCAPELLMGIPFVDDTPDMVDITPARPTFTSVADALEEERQAMTQKRSTTADGAEDGEHDENSQLPEDASTDSEADEPASEHGESAAEEYGPFHAHNDGMEAFAAKRSIYSFPKEWEQLKRTDLIDAFKAGFRKAETESGKGKTK